MKRALGLMASFPDPVRFRSKALVFEVGTLSLEEQRNISEALRSMMNRPSAIKALCTECGKGLTGGAPCECQKSEAVSDVEPAG